MFARTLPTLCIILTFFLTSCGQAESPITSVAASPTETPLPAPTELPLTSTPVPAQTASPAGLVLAVPQGDPPTLDGVLSPGEWDNALQQEFTNGGDLFLMQDSGYLYLGLHENFEALTVTSICLEHEDEISILHSSGSLGTASFKRADQGWQLTKPFKWDLYEVTSHMPADEQKRKAFLETNGWLANLGSMTETEEIEYQIALPDGPFRIAVAHLLPPSFSQAAWWPPDLSDDCRKVELLQANIAENLNTPLTLQFSPDTWGRPAITPDLSAYAFPVSIDPTKPYLFYLHGKIIEEQGLPAISPDYGEYEYGAILEKLASYGFLVISEQRPKNTDPLEAAQKVTEQIKVLLKGGVPAKNITIVGASKGAGIAIFVSNLLQNDKVNFVILGICHPDTVDELKQDKIFLSGNVLSIYDSSDELAGSCQELLTFSEGKGLARHDEIVLHVGTGHGILYQPLDAWLIPAVEWGK